MVVTFNCRSGRTRTDGRVTKRRWSEPVLGRSSETEARPGRSRGRRRPLNRKEAAFGRLFFCPNRDIAALDIDWNTHAAGWDDDPDVQHYAREALTSLRSQMDPDRLHILDFGCGTGLLTVDLAQTAAHVIALDPAEKMIGVLAHKGLNNVTTFNATLSAELIDREPAFAAPFDLVTAASVCAFLPDYTATLRLLRKLLRPGGHLVQWDWLATDETDDFGFSAHDLRAIRTAADFDVVSIDVAFSISRDADGPMQVLQAVARKP